MSRDLATIGLIALGIVVLVVAIKIAIGLIAIAVAVALVIGAIVLVRSLLGGGHAR
jgi:hypothetical protein